MRISDWSSDVCSSDLAFLALAGYALDRAFVDVAGQGQRDRLKAYVDAYAGDVDFARDGTLIPPFTPPDGRFDRPGSGLYAEVVLRNGGWGSNPTRGPQMPAAPLRGGGAENLAGPVTITRRGRPPGGGVT